MSDDFEITPCEDGPLVVKGAAGLIGSDGAEIEAKPVMALCRCGASKNKPFCDGSHTEAGFKSEAPGKPAGPDRLFRYEGSDLTVVFNPRICAHAAECGRISPDAFNTAQKPWVNPDAAAREVIEAVVAACPSGALQIEGEGQRIPDRADIMVQENGPYWVVGGALEAGIPGEGGTEAKRTLCRCGLSGNKPFCDGTHRDGGWRE